MHTQDQSLDITPEIIQKAAQYAKHAENLSALTDILRKIQGADGVRDQIAAVGLNEDLLVRILRRRGTARRLLAAAQSDFNTSGPQATYNLARTERGPVDFAIRCRLLDDLLEQLHAADAAGEVFRPCDPFGQGSRNSRRADLLSDLRALARDCDQTPERDAVLAKAAGSPITRIASAGAEAVKRATVLDASGRADSGGHRSGTLAQYLAASLFAELFKGSSGAGWTRSDFTLAALTGLGHLVAGEHLRVTPVEARLSGLVETPKAPPARRRRQTNASSHDAPFRCPAHDFHSSFLQAKRAIKASHVAKEHLDKTLPHQVIQIGDRSHDSSMLDFARITEPGTACFVVERYGHGAFGGVHDSPVVHSTSGLAYFTAPLDVKDAMDLLRQETVHDVTGLVCIIDMRIEPNADAPNRSDYVIEGVKIEPVSNNALEALRDVEDLAQHYLQKRFDEAQRAYQEALTASLGDIRYGLGDIT